MKEKIIFMDIQDNCVTHKINRDCNQIIKEIDEINILDIILLFNISYKGLKNILSKIKELLNKRLSRDILINKLKIKMRYIYYN